MVLDFREFTREARGLLREIAKYDIVRMSIRTLEKTKWSAVV